ncbi:5-methylcytosine-specific restriction enzyme [Saliniradius amylolyticus]|uniref:5-methylcytosine-specific restriction enzyme n=1 Tax=Saliniradius amylolyticus TaxID=2183582 RepID=A0A2S2DZ89_9ALTE|nr:HNH endonuclease signature motif containing protein [Saliniradius amylolyticus]AWL10696.1 5-methylcytosine-specific restriction enzyme [Saliniradius amylolyticus]
MSQEIEQAFTRYRTGERPWTHVERDWYVADGVGRLYPLKYIWALATNSAPRNFNTSHARKELAEREYSVVRLDSKQKYYNEWRKKADQLAGSTLSDEEIRKRANEAPKKPVKHLTASYQFGRNPYVSAFVLRRANGVCERCGSPAPFRKRFDNSPYLEVHHTVPLSEGGTDTIDNTEAVCPNCHREAHYG